MKDEKCRTVPEFAIKEWMKKNRFEMSEFSLEVNGNKGVITDRTGEKMAVMYDPGTKTVSEEQTDPADI